MPRLPSMARARARGGLGALRRAASSCIHFTTDRVNRWLSKRRSMPDGEAQQSSVTPGAHSPETPAQSSSAAIEERKEVQEHKELPEHGEGQERDEPFHGITTSIPNGSFGDLSLPGQVDFSKRGSMLIGGQKARSPANTLDALNVDGKAEQVNGIIPRKQNRETPARSNIPPERVLSIDEELLSQKVRSMYEYGEDKVMDWRDGRLSGVARSKVQDDKPFKGATKPQDITVNGDGEFSASGAGTAGDETEDVLEKPPPKKEIPILAGGGIEDWSEVDARDVDRYGFIVPRKIPSRSSNTSVRARTADNHPGGPHRVSTALQLASETPRRKRTLRGIPSDARTTLSAFHHQSPLSRKTSGPSLRPPRSVSSFRSSFSLPHRPFHYAANRLPYNRDRRCMDEAGDMLTLPPGLADIAEHEEGGRAAAAMRAKEFEREEKWRKMARIVSGRNTNGEGMVFDFDTEDPKLIERVWKGIPDRWRATAWHAFLSQSAKRRNIGSPDSEIISIYHELLTQSSADDPQIDIDVPRTINRHIMFRRRYMGGQRLLFRTLHALSLYFPTTGYVQGMASLAATLLCYYAEEITFVMLVRLFQLRGLETLFQPEFGGLMAALDELETKWLIKEDVSKKLNELDISPTAYGTRWYLTLFSYSIPFPAQLRVWDVFMLLGDPVISSPKPSYSSLQSDSPGNQMQNHNRTSQIQNQVRASQTSPTTLHSTSSTTTIQPQPEEIPPNFAGTLDPLHAVSAAILQATREILLDSDFENAMKVLTSFVPIRDEELLMRVARVEWYRHRPRLGWGGRLASGASAFSGFSGISGISSASGTSGGTSGHSTPVNPTSTGMADKLRRVGMRR
ncbi:MAG: hypothetical protein M1819_007026 [Sarea resinae]|nr:MAG: hypothetical protein M1819_007026 [Sarea resinae]